MNFKNILGTSCACLAVVSFNASAALLGRLPATPGGKDYQAYYDDVADLTWLTDANKNGAMAWVTAYKWAATLTVGGVSGWRLPDTLQPDASCAGQNLISSWGLNCTGSEMGYLFYNTLGNTAGSLTSTGPFSNVQPDLYWSATSYVGNVYDKWDFSMLNGFQSYADISSSFYGWAVKSGDVVPVPAAVWLFGSGLLGLVGLARRKKV